MRKPSKSDVSHSAMAEADVIRQTKLKALEAQASEEMPQRSQVPSLKNDFTEQSSPEVPVFCDDYIKETPRSIQILGFLLVHLLNRSMGPEYLARIAIDHDIDKTGIILKITPIDFSLALDPLYYGPVIQELHNGTQDRIEIFLKGLEPFFNTDDGKIKPDTGAIHFKKKFDLFVALAGYCESLGINIFDIHSFEQEPRAFSKNFAGFKIGKGQIFREVTGIAHLDALKELGKDEENTEEYLNFFSTFKPYSSRRQQRAEGMINCQQVPYSEMMFSIYFAMLYEQIKLEDGYDRKRNVLLDLDTNILRPTIN